MTEPRPWELVLDSDLIRMKMTFRQYFTSIDFVSIWQTSKHNGELNVQLEYTIMKLIDEGFSIDSPRMYAMKEVMETTTIAQLRIMSYIYANVYSYNLTFIPLPHSQVFEHMINNMLYACGKSFECVPYKYPTLFHDTCDVYKRHWKAAELIQYRWRECVANPLFTVCQKRLLGEWSLLEKELKKSYLGKT